MDRSNPIAEEKRALRATLRARPAFDPEERAALDRAVCAHVVSLPEWGAMQVLLAYEPMFAGEVDTGSLCRSAAVDRVSVYTQFVLVNGIMRWQTWPDAVDEIEQMRSSKEAAKTQPPLNSAGTLALVPGLAFTRQCTRIGRGRGYYDRFLIEFGGISIGLTYEMNLLDILPLERHDQPVDIVVTDQAVYRRSGVSQ